MPIIYVSWSGKTTKWSGKCQGKVREFCEGSWLDTLCILIIMSTKSSFYNEHDIKNNEKHVSWAQRGLQNHHQTFHDRCPEKIGRLSKKSDHFYLDMSRKYWTGLNLLRCLKLFFRKKKRSLPKNVRSTPMMYQHLLVKRKVLLTVGCAAFRFLFSHTVHRKYSVAGNWYLLMLTHWGRVTHICVVELGHHWFR